MNRIDAILKALEKHSARDPLPFAEVLERTGIPESELQQLLDLMYDHIPGRINRAKLTRAGVEQMVYWPTGALHKGFAGDGAGAREHLKNTWKLNARKSAKPAARALPKAAPPIIEKALPMPTAQEKTPKSLAILKLIESQPGISGGDIRASIGVATVDPYIEHYIKRQEVIKTTLNRRRATYQLPDGVKADDIYVPPRGRRGARNQHSKAMKPVANVQPTSQPAPKNPLGAAPEPEKFKCAFTSERTLILFGLTFMPIELTHAQTKTLLDYIERQGLLYAIPDEILD